MDVLEDRQEDFECLAAAVPRFASMLLAPEGDPDAPDIPTPCSYVEAIPGPYSSQWQAAMDAEMASWKSTGTYVDEVPPPGANIVDGMWIFRVKRPPGSPTAFKARSDARGFSQRHGVDYFHTFSPTPKMNTLRVLLHVAAQRDYELHSLDFSTAFLYGSLHEEIWFRRPPGFTESFPAGTQWSLRRPVYGLRQAPRERHDTLRTTLAALGFAPSTADPSLFLRTDTSLPPFYVLVYVDDLVFATTDTEALTLVKSELQKRHTCIDLGEPRSYLGLWITRDRARRTITLTQSHMVHQVLQRFSFQFSSPQPTPLSTSHSLSAPILDESVEPTGPYPELVGCLISSCEAEIYAGAMAAQKLRWLTYVLTDLVEQPRSPRVLLTRESADALRASASTALAEALHTFTLDSSASHCFFRDCTVVKPLAAPVPVSLADPTGGPVVARASTVLPSPLAAASPQHALPSPFLWPSQVPALPPALACTTVPSLRRGAAARRSSLLRERYFLLVVDDYTRYTTVFPLRRKADVSGILIPSIHATRRQLRERFCRNFPVLRLHSDRGGEFSSDLFAEFYRDEGIVQLFTLPASPQQNGIAERRIGLIMELNLCPRVYEPETSPTLRWTGKVGDASVFWVWGALSLLRDAKASKLSSRTLRCVFLGFPTDAPPWQFYHPRSRRVFSSQDITFDESVCFYRLHQHASFQKSTGYP
ncbi:unnamed protein product [Closterium sp. NIES-54]